MYWLVEARRPPKTYGHMAEHEVAALHDEMIDSGQFPGLHAPFQPEE